MLFEIGSGLNCIPCAISRAALDELGGERHLGGAALIRCFLARQEHVEAIVRDKLGEMPGGPASLIGTLNIWASDLDDLPPSGGSKEGLVPVRQLRA